MFRQGAGSPSWRMICAKLSREVFEVRIQAEDGGGDESMVTMYLMFDLIELMCTQDGNNIVLFRILAREIADRGGIERPSRVRVSLTP